MSQYDLNKLPSSPLHVLQADGKWVIVRDIEKYNLQSSFIKRVLDDCQGTGRQVKHTESKHDANNISTIVLRIDSNRVSTVAFCLQHDRTTNGLRYMVYGTRYNRDCDYGIGVDLEYYDIERPKNIAQHMSLLCF